MRLNKKPIFIVGFARGGSGLLLNLLLSHPNVCLPYGETQQLIRGGWESLLYTIPKRLLRYLPILIAEKAHLFSIQDWNPRPSRFTAFTEKKLDEIFYNEKLNAHYRPTGNLYKTENEKYSLEEVANARLVCKNLNGLIFLSQPFHAMYPDATFIAIVRNGLAVCEGHARRGHNLIKFAKSYEKGCQQIISDSQNIPNYHIVRYEDIVTKPIETLEKIYNYADLDINLVKQIRLETTKIIDKDGKHHFIHNKNKKQIIWYTMDNFMSHFNNNVNENQINRLSNTQRSTIIEICKDTLEYFGYLQ